MLKVLKDVEGEGSLREDWKHCEELAGHVARAKLIFVTNSKILLFQAMKSSTTFIIIVAELIIVILLYMLNKENFQFGVAFFLLLLISLAYLKRREKLLHRELTDLIF